MVRFTQALLAAVLFVLFSSMSASAQSQCPDNFVAFRGSTAPLACSCSASATQLGHVYGMDIYAEDSSICRSALHAGTVSAQGGFVYVLPVQGQPAYAGSTRNGVTSSNWSSMPGSFAFAGAQVAVPVPVPVPVPAPLPVPMPVPVPAQVPIAIAPVPAAPPVYVQPAPPAGGGLAALCPDNFVSYRGTTGILTCGCPAENTGLGFVYGMDVYTEDSGVCQSAVHAGVLSGNGGNVSIQPLPGQSAYAGTTRNGITSYNWSSMPGSFAFLPVALPAPAASIFPTAQGPATAGQCPDDFVSMRNRTTPLTCGCSAEATKRGFAYGTDIYTEDSSICAAALHLGAVSANGGDVAVMALASQPFYAGSTRNGVTSSNWGTMPGSFYFLPLQQAAAAPVASSPVQAPIAQTLAQTGSVDLYIYFAFNSAELVPTAAPVLSELLAVLRADPTLNLSFIGHTDSVGNDAYNLDLSARRAESVRYWLLGQGIVPTRLRAEGRGETQPIGDNNTELGRATNRRVQALRTP